MQCAQVSIPGWREAKDVIPHESWHQCGSNPWPLDYESNTLYTLNTYKEQPCEKYGLYPHPIASVCDRPPELQAEFPVLDSHSAPAESRKRRRVCFESCVITNEQIVQLQAEESGQKTCTKVPKVENCKDFQIFSHHKMYTLYTAPC